MTRTVLRGLGQLLITAGVVVLLFTGYELYGTGLQTNRNQQSLQDQLTDGWGPAPPGESVTSDGDPSAGVVGVKPAQALAILWIPRLGKGWEWVIVEGVSRANLRTGPGHYPGTALPGQIGNFAVAGHRTTYGYPFNQLNTLRKGDAVVVETKLMWITYRVSATEIVQPGQVDVVAPVPRRAGLKPTERLITLTTCDPLYSAKHRLIVHAVFEVAVPKAAGLPSALQG